MDIKIQAIHFDATEKLNQFIEKKVSKLEKFGGETGKVEVSLKVVKPETAMNKEVAIKLQAAGTTLFAQEVCDTFEEATMKTVDSLVRQLSKSKDKQKNR
ncbi:MAG: ribosome-associated translation inhibitor RaiA [Paraprevotella sp.]|nr:ribosome-associated translation inhibitor RaiA [Paraprevotella sp.]